MNSINSILGMIATEAAEATMHGLVDEIQELKARIAALESQLSQERELRTERERRIKMLEERENLAFYAIAEATKPKLENRDLKDKLTALESELKQEQERAGKLEKALNVEPLREYCHATFNGGHRDAAMIEAFHHGMDTVFNLLADRFKKLLKTPPPSTEVKP